MALHLPVCAGPPGADLRPAIKKEALDSDCDGSSCETFDDFLRTALWPKAVKREEGSSFHGTRVLVLREMEESDRRERVCHALTYSVKPLQTSGDLDLKPETPADLEVRNPPHVCEVCGTRRACRAELQLHVKVHAGENQADQRGRGFRQSTHAPAPQKRSGSQTQARTREIKIPSRQSEEGDPAPESARKTEPPQRLGPKRRPAQGKHVCELCGVEYVRRQNLTSHLRIHTGETPYCCGVCGKGFRRSDWLALHENTHRGEKKSRKKRCFPCTLCEKTYQSGEGLRNHSRTHTGERPFLCRICGASFHNAGTLSIHHLNRHSEHRPHVCSVCGRGFKRSGTLNKHARTHTGEKPFLCGRCRKAFRYRYCLTLHERHCFED